MFQIVVHTEQMKVGGFLQQEAAQEQLIFGEPSVLSTAILIDISMVQAKAI